MVTQMKQPTRSRSTRRRYAGILIAALLAVTGALLPTLTAHADDGPFTVDGDVPDAGATLLNDAFGNTKELGPKNSNTTKIGVIHKAATPMLDTTNPNAQVDLRRAWLDGARDSNDHDWIYFAWERDSNSGSGFISFEFMKNAAPAACAYATKTVAQLIASCNPWANRAAGDFIILWDQSGSSQTLYLRVWSGTAPNLTLSAPTALVAAQSQAQFSADGFKGEAAIDITAALYAGVPQCLSFANVIPGTVTGNSDSADYKDTILTDAAPFGGCDSTTVTTPKQADGTTNIPSGGLVLGASGNTVRDSAVVDVDTGTPTPSGSVEFFICKVDAPALCDSGGTSIGTTALTGLSYPVTVLSPTTTVTQVGRYCFRAVFSGDSTQGIGTSSDSSAGECFTVNAVASTISTSQSWVPNDSATVSAPAGGDLAGSVTFTLYPTSNCTGTRVMAPETVPVAGASPQTVSTSNTTAVTATGTFSWKVSYSSTNGAQRSISDSCQETSSLTVANGSSVSSS
jgi:hypothetical protein